MENKMNVEILLQRLIEIYGEKNINLRQKKYTN